MPALGLRSMADRPERVLLVTVGAEPARSARILAVAAALQAGSAFAVTVVRGGAAPGALDAKGVTVALAAGRFDVVVFAIDQALDTVPALGDFTGGILLLHVGCEADRPDRGGFAFDRAVQWNDAEGARGVDRVIQEVLAARGAVRSPEWQATRPGRNVLLLVPHRPKQDPRLGWMAENAGVPLLVHQLGMHPATEGALQRAIGPRGGLLCSVPAVSYVPGDAVRWRALAGDHPGAQAAIERLLWMERALCLRPEPYLEAVGAWTFDERALTFRWLLQYFLDVTATLLHEGSRLRGIDAIVAADLPALPAAILLAAFFGVPVVFDAHEYWPEADLGSADFEQQFWERLERQLLPHTALRATVSSGLARLMERQYGLPFMLLPNAEPLASQCGPHAQPHAGQPCVFLFQGGFARGRGIELLIAAWPDVCEDAHLVLRGPLGEWRDRMIALAREGGLLDQRVFFPPPVDESQMIAAACEAAVGLVPYEPQGANHQHCCPNKVSQYMAAGLAILANDTSFVREVVEAAGAGLVVDFSNRQALVEAINRLAADTPLRQAHADAARRYFAQSFHWEALSADFYGELRRLVHDRPERPLQIFGPTCGVGENRPGRRRSGWSGLYAAAGNRPGVALVDRVWRRTPESVRRLARPFARRLRLLLWKP
jgi:glycosyltransferase involved in cell wall biosynthesis